MFSPELVAFIDEHIDSIELVEVLLLLRERSPATLNVTAINELIRSDEDSIRTRLAALSRISLVRRTSETAGEYVYDPPNHFRQVVEELALAYRERRTRIVELIYSPRARELEHFSNAFVWRKKEK